MTFPKELKNKNTHQRKTSSLMRSPRVVKSLAQMLKVLGLLNKLAAVFQKEYDLGWPGVKVESCKDKSYISRIIYTLYRPFASKKNLFYKKNLLMSWALLYNNVRHWSTHTWTFYKMSFWDHSWDHSAFCVHISKNSSQTFGFFFFLN